MLSGIMPCQPADIDIVGVARTQAIYGGNPRLRAFAWIDILVIVGFTIVVIICAAFVK